MGFFSAIGSAFSSAASWVGDTIGRAASWAGRALTTVVSAGGKIVSGLASTAGTLLGNLGIFRKDDPPVKEWGDRAMQAEDQHVFPEQFDDFEDYLDKLRNFDLDPDKTAESTDVQKTFKGLEVAGRALENRFDAPEGSMANVFVLSAANPDYFTSERFQSLLEGGVRIDDIADYFQGRLGGAESLKIEDELVHHEQMVNPGKDEQSCREELIQAAEKTQDKLQNILN